MHSDLQRKCYRILWWIQQIKRVPIWNGLHDLLRCHLKFHSVNIAVIIFERCCNQLFLYKLSID